MIKRHYLNNGWKFSPEYKEEMRSVTYDDSAMQEVRLPHTVKETPLHYFDESEYQMISCYRKVLNIPEEYQGKTLLLTFEGIGHDSEVWLNGIKVAEHHCGYTAFTTDLTAAAICGADNILTVKVDSRESLNIPPFGFVIDYMTYGGIYRDVYLEVKEPSYLADLFVSTKQAERFPKKGQPQVVCCRRSQVQLSLTIKGAEKGMRLRHYMRKIGVKTNKPVNDYKLMGTTLLMVTPSASLYDMQTSCMSGEIELWDVEHPALYQWKTELVKGDTVLDEREVIYGYRKAVFREEGFYLNGRKLKICGLNRHQSYAYVGYAMPESMQKLDADILKKELGLNAVRTSHYPQSQYFLDRCDELGLLVFTEIPGWQHIGNDSWKEQAVKNVEDMVIQNRNHPSIILWGVRINESVDDEALYTKTNEVAHRLDPSRQTGGVRYLKNSQLLEDVYTYNDFVHCGGNRGCDKKADVTSDPSKGYMVTEYNGHMYPTKAFDWEEHRLQHALRHARVLNDVAGQHDIAGSFGWCMFDYNTHQDFGSGDRICYHGVMDMFRNPKMAAAVYASRQNATPVLEMSSSMDIGEHPGGNHGKTFIFTNADSVRMYKNDRLLKEYLPENEAYPDLQHPPIHVDDYVGDILETAEGMSHKKAEEIKLIINEVAEKGLNKISTSAKMRAGKMMLMRQTNMDEAIRLYNRYVGDWGGSATVYRFDAIKNGEVVKTVTKGPAKGWTLEIRTDHTKLVEKNSYDVAAVRIRAVDEYGNVAAFYNEPLILETEGEIQLIGPEVVALSGGMGGTYVKTTGRAGEGTLSIRTNTGKAWKLHFTVEI